MMGFFLAEGRFLGAGIIKKATPGSKPVRMTLDKN
jgi:hypothetical protein